MCKTIQYSLYGLCRHHILISHHPTSIMTASSIAGQVQNIKGWLTDLVLLPGVIFVVHPLIGITASGVTLWSMRFCCHLFYNEMSESTSTLIQEDDKSLWIKRWTTWQRGARFFFFPCFCTVMLPGGTDPVGFNIMTQTCLLEMFDGCHYDYSIDPHRKSYHLSF